MDNLYKTGLLEKMTAQDLRRTEDALHEVIIDNAREVSNLPVSLQESFRQFTRGMIDDEDLGHILAGHIHLASEPALRLASDVFSLMVSKGMVEILSADDPRVEHFQNEPVGKFQELSRPVIDGRIARMSEDEWFLLKNHLETAGIPCDDQQRGPADPGQERRFVVECSAYFNSIDSGLRSKAVQRKPSV